MIKLTRPLITFDLETTGVDVAKDRLVSLAAIKDFPDGARKELSLMVNPCKLIPPEVVELIGITNEQVAGLDPFEDCASMALHFFTGCDLAGFNLLNFDVPLLWEEFDRAGIEWDLTGINIIDAGNIFKKQEPRTLSAAVQFYCGRTMENVHNAMADTEATREVLFAQINRYRDLPDHACGLAEFSAFDKRVDLAGKIVLNDQGEPVYNIGKSKGMRVVDDPGFGNWMLGKDFTQNTKSVIRDLLWANASIRQSADAGSDDLPF